MSLRASLKDKSREISGYCARNRGIAEPRKSAAGGGAVRRNMPAGLPRNSFVDSSADRYSSSTGRSRSRRRSPAAVGATDRVVRSTRRTPSCSSRLRISSLTRGGDRASCLAALVKLLSSTTATKAVVSARLGPCIGAIHYSKNPNSPLRLFHLTDYLHSRPSYSVKRNHAR